MRIFGPEKMDSMLVKLGLEEGEAIIHPWINKAIEKAQEKVESRNFEQRKQILKYDNVMNDQRSVIYEQRLEIMDADDVSETTRDFRHETVEDIVLTHIPPKSYPEEWNIPGLGVEIRQIFGVDLPLTKWMKEEGVEEQVITERIIKEADARIQKKIDNYGEDFWLKREKALLLITLDRDWKEHLSTLEHLRDVIRLRAFGQRDPLNEYKTEAFTMFEQLLTKIRQDVSQALALVEFNIEQSPLSLMPKKQELHAKHIDPATGKNDAAPARPATGATTPQLTVATRKAAAKLDPNDPATWGRVPRNSLCPCGSGKKYKHCHGKFAPPEIR